MTLSPFRRRRRRQCHTSVAIGTLVLAIGKHSALRASIGSAFDSYKPFFQSLLSRTQVLGLLGLDKSLGIFAK